jgi:superfamily II RNA helicase
MSSVESKILQQLEEISTQMKKLNTRVETVEKEFASFKRQLSQQLKLPLEHNLTGLIGVDIIDQNISPHQSTIKPRSPIPSL